MSDIVDRLRSVRGSFIVPVESPSIFAWAEEAADEIERLRGFIDSLSCADKECGQEFFNYKPMLCEICEIKAALEGGNTP